MEKRLQFSDLPQSVSDFYNTIGNVGNVYRIYSVNENDEITDEAFGKNVITDYGLYRRFESSAEYNLYVGNSADEPSISSTSMGNTITGLTTYRSDSGNFSPTRFVRYPITYFPATETKGSTFNQLIRLIKYYYDYNISGITEDFEITEIGIGESDTKLYSHALIYDSNGNISSITKKPNQRLYIEVYWQSSIPVAYIEDCYNKGYSVFVEPYYLLSGAEPDGLSFLNMARSVMLLGNVRPTIVDGYSLSSSLSVTENHTSSLKSALNGITCLLEHKFGSISGVCLVSGNISDGYHYGCNHTSGEAISDSSYEYWTRFRYSWGSPYAEETINRHIILHEFLKLPNDETEELESEEVFTDEWWSPSFSKTFGYGNITSICNTSNDDYGCYAFGALPVADFDITSLTRYNHSTKEWDIIEEYVSDPNFNYDNSLFDIQGNMWNGTSYNIYCNPHWKNQKIKKFNATGVAIYATDTYWDATSFQLIPNISNVPDELSNKKYYLTTATDSFKRIKPQYWRSDYDAPHRLLGYNPITIDVTGLIESHVSTSRESYTYPSSTMLSSDKNGWILLTRAILYPDTDDGPKAYPIKTYLDYQCTTDSITLYARYGNDDRIVIISDFYYSSKGMYPYGCRIYDVSDHSSAPPYIDIPNPFTNKAYGSSSSYSEYTPIYSWADSGLLCAQQYGYNEAFIIDTYNWDQPIIRSITNCKFAHIQNLSDYVVYQRSDITLVTRIEIMNPRTGEIVDSFDLPTGNTYTVNGICGWKTFVYIHVTYSGITDIIKYNMNTHAIEFNNFVWDVISSSNTGVNYERREFSNDECYMIITNKYEYRSLFVDAKTPMKLEYLYNSNQDYTDRVYKFSLGSLKYIDGGKNLVYVGKRTSGYMSGVSNYYQSNSALCVFDIGKRIDSGKELMIVPYSNMPYGYCYNCDYGVYKDYIFQYTRGNTLTLYPIAYSLAHKMKGTTHSITSYNNPVRISGKKAQLKFTNDMEKIYNYDPSHNVCP